MSKFPYAASAADREPERLADDLGLGVGAVSGEVRDRDVDRGPHPGAEVGRARGDHAVVIRLRKREPDDVNWAHVGLQAPISTQSA